jgi:hypothetical protein
MPKNVNFDLCREAVTVLANVGSSAETIVTEARNSCKRPIAEPPWNEPKIKLTWDTIAENNGWLIEQNNWGKQIRLVGPNRKIRASIQLDDKLVEFLSHVIRIGNEEVKINNYFSNMALDKDGEFIVLVGRMGAKHINSISLDSKNTGFGFGGGGANSGDNSSVGSFSVGVNANFKGDLKKFKKYDVYFEDNTANFSDDLLIKSKWFKNDPDMNALFATLKERKITRWEYKSSLSESSNIDFSVEARKIGVEEANLKSAFEKRKGVYREFIVEF